MEVFKIILILLLALNFKKVLSEKTEPDVKIQDLIKNSLADANDGHDVSDSIEMESNVALKYYNEWKGYEKNQWTESGIKTCDTELPSIEEIDFNNIFWQTIPNTNKTQYFLFNAFYDNRGNDKYVRVVASQREPEETGLWGLLYFSDHRQPVQTWCSLGKIPNNFLKDWYKAITISCIIPREVESMVPRAVSLTTTSDCPKKANNSLRVIYGKQNKTRESFAVCHNPLRYSRDLSLRLIEWLELLRILGVSKVILNSMAVHPNMERVLNYYQTNGFVDWRNVTLPGEQPNIRSFYESYGKIMPLNKIWGLESIGYYDCFYRNIYKYEYIGVFDIDELIVPTNADNWTQMIDNIKKNPNFHEWDKVSEYIFIGAKFFSDLPDNSTSPEMYIMSHPYQGGWQYDKKTIQVSDLAIDPFTHYNLGCILPKECDRYDVDPRDGYFLHHRVGWKVTDQCEDRKCVKYDPIVLKYKTQLESSMKSVLDQIFK